MSGLHVALLFGGVIVLIGALLWLIDYIEAKLKDAERGK